MYHVFLDNIIFELQTSGGISKYWGKLIEHGNDNNGISLTMVEGKNKAKNIFFHRGISLDIIKDVSLPLIIRRYLPVFNKIKYDIFHSSYYRTPLFIKKTSKQVVTVHDFMYEFFDTGIKRKIHIWQKRKAMLNAHAIICVSQHTKKDLLELYPEINPAILHVVPNGVDKEFKPLYEETADIHIKNEILKRNEYLLYVGNRMGCKNFKFVLDLLAQSEFLQRKKLGVVCIGGGEFNHEEIDFIRNKISHELTNIQHVDNEDLNKIYNGAYALIFPSKYEGFGIPALEAQAAGCPVLYAKTSSLPEVVAYEELGYALDNIQEVDARLQLLQDTNFRCLIVKMGIDHAMKYTWRNTANLTFEVYKHVLNIGN